MHTDYLESSFLGSREAARSMPKQVLPDEGYEP